MRIAILGWGSLIPSPRNLAIESKTWNTDGPYLPIEFARISNGNRLTLVIYPKAMNIQTLYNISTLSTLKEALNNLQIREGNETQQYLGYYDFRSAESHINRHEDYIITELERWNERANVDVVIWTDLGTNFKDRTNTPLTLLNIERFLREISTEELCSARQYILTTPEQTRTELRGGIEEILKRIEA